MVYSIKANKQSSHHKILEHLHPFLCCYDEFLEDAVLLRRYIEHNSSVLELEQSWRSNKYEDLWEILHAICVNVLRKEMNRIRDNSSIVGECKEVLWKAGMLRSTIMYSELMEIAGTMKKYNGVVPKLDDIHDSSLITTVFIRPEDEKFWGTYIKESKKGHPVCGVGNPGIGKTTTTFYLLKSLVMEEKQPVIYRLRRSKQKYEVYYYLVLDLNG